MSVERHNDGRYRYRATGYYSNGRPCRISGTAPKTDNTRAAALKKEADHLAWLATQPPPADPMEGRNANPPTPLTAMPTGSLIPPDVAPEPAKPPAPTLGEFEATYLDSARIENAYSTVEGKEDKLRLHIVPHLGHLPLDQITYPVIADFLVTLSKTRNAKVKREIQFLKGKTINNILDILSNLLDLARRRGLIVAVPEIPRAKTTPPPFDFLSFEELERLLAVERSLWTTMVLVAARCGLRRGELLGVRKGQDVNRFNHQMHIRESFVRGRFGPPKWGKLRDVPMSSQVEDALSAMPPRAGERVFCDDHGKPFTTGVMASQLERLCRLAGLRTIGWHVLRHTFASHLVMRGVHIVTVKELMGHSSLAITMRYVHLAPHISQDAVSVLDEPAPIPGALIRRAPAADPAVPVPAVPVPAVPVPAVPVPAVPVPSVPGPSAIGARVKTSRQIRRERADARDSARNRQETSPAAVLN